MFPVSCRLSTHRHSLLGPSCPRWVIRFPHGQRTGPQQHDRDPTGLPCSTRARHDRGGCPLYPETRRCSLAEVGSIDQRLPHSSGLSYHLADTSHLQGSPSRDIARGLHVFTRPVFPFTCSLRMQRTPLGLTT